MHRRASRRQRTRPWVRVAVLVAVLVLATCGGAAAKALSGRSADAAAGPAGSTKSTAPPTTSATTTAQGVAAAAATGSPHATKTRKPRPTTTTTPASTTTSAPTTTTEPGTDVKIPLPRFSDMLVDEARGRLYFTGGKGTGTIVVTDLDGSNLRTLDGYFKGAAGMTLSPDGTKLNVALSDSDGIAIIDTETFAIDFYYVGTHDGVPTCPRDLAWAAGQLWFSWGCESSPFAGIGRVDPETRDYNLRAAPVDERISSPALLATVSSQPDMVIAGTTGTSPSTLYRFEATPTQLVQQAWRWTGGFIAQLAITPDGSQVIVPSGAPYYHPVLRTSDLAEVHRYPTAAYPNAVAIRPDGLVAAGINGAYEKDVYIFEPGGTTPIATYEFGHLPGQETWAHTLVEGGLAWGPGNRFYAVTEQLSEPDVVTLRIRELP
jgi:sugar lactone lactonase YvrE